MSHLAVTDLVLGISSFLVAALLWGLVRAVARGQVGRNGALGLRTPASMPSDQAWLWIATLGSGVSAALFGGCGRSLI